MKRAIQILGMALSVLLGAQSCEYKFEIKNDSKPCIWMQCVPEQDSLIVRVNYAKPAVGDYNDVVDFQASEVKVTVNGKSLPVSKADLEKGYKPGTWYALCHLDKGDEVRVEASGSGVDKASGETTIPEPPVLADAVMKEVIIGGESGTEVTLTLGEIPSEDEFFGLKIIQRTETPDTVEYRYLTPELMQKAATGTLDLDEMAQVNYSKHTIDFNLTEPMMLISGKKFALDGKYSFLLYTYEDFWFDPDAPLFDGNLPNIPDLPEIPGHLTSKADDGQEHEPNVFFRYKFIVYRLSPELYYYARAQYLGFFDFLSNLGLTPANFSYTNIHNGLGIVGALSSAESGWIKAPVSSIP